MMGLVPEDIEQDFPLEMALEAASQAIARECNREFEQKTHIQRIDGPGTKFLRLRNFPIHSVTGLRLGEATLSSDEYEIEVENGMLFKRDYWPKGTRNIEVEYVAGYNLPNDGVDAPEPTLPRNYELACILYAQTLMQTPGVSSERVGDIAVTYAAAATGALPQAVTALIRL